MFVLLKSKPAAFLAKKKKKGCFPSTPALNYSLLPSIRTTHTRSYNMGDGIRRRSAVAASLILFLALSSSPTPSASAGRTQAHRHGRHGSRARATTASTWSSVSRYLSLRVEDAFTVRLPGCTGTLVDRDWVLTASHCFAGLERYGMAGGGGGGRRQKLTLLACSD